MSSLLLTRSFPANHMAVTPRMTGGLDEGNLPKLWACAKWRKKGDLHGIKREFEWRTHEVTFANISAILTMEIQGDSHTEEAVCCLFDALSTGYFRVKSAVDVLNSWMVELFGLANVWFDGRRCIMGTFHVYMTTNYMTQCKVTPTKERH